MTWTPITGPTDMPEEFKPVLISDGVDVGLGFRRERELSDMAKAQEIRADGWVIIWPVLERTLVPTKWCNLPSA